MQLDIVADAPTADAEPTGVGMGQDARGFGEDPGVIEELLVEELSIDGMCGLY